MFGKKDATGLHGSEIVFQKNEVDFGNFKSYCANYVTNGDWVIPLGSFFSLDDEYEHDLYIEGDDTKEFMSAYDDRLITVFRRQDENLVQKNIRMLGSRDPSKRGLNEKILKILYQSEKFINKIPDKKLISICDKIRNVYDKSMKDPTTGQQIETHIWIPVWRIVCDKALVVSILGRINIIFT